MADLPQDVDRTNKACRACGALYEGETHVGCPAAAPAADASASGDTPAPSGPHLPEGTLKLAPDEGTLKICPACSQQYTGEHGSCPGSQGGRPSIDELARDRADQRDPARRDRLVLVRGNQKMSLLLLFQIGHLLV